MPLKGSEGKLAAALKAAAKSTEGDEDKAWEKVAQAITAHLTESAVVTGSTPNGGPLMDGRVT
ncbi:MAG: hypothetical protein M3Q07_16910 [Pseudobdellovibrionaceae bacterium]|nr:hypothetical protein [Pseudobdellovibrionaceae bacterium]